MRTIALDTETFYDSECSVKVLGPRAYTRHPKFDVLLVSVHDGTDEWCGRPSDFNWNALDGQIVVSHNASFDQQVFRELCRRAGSVLARPVEWNCTANLTSFLCNRRALAQAVEYLFHEKVTKAVRDEMMGKTWADIEAAGEAEGATQYALRDARYCWRLWNEFSADWGSVERQLSLDTLACTAGGGYIDQPLLKRYLGLVQAELFEVEKLLPWIADGHAPTSTKAIAEQCRLENIPPPPVQDEDQEGFDKWEADYSPTHPWIPAVASRRQVNKLLGTLQTIEKRLIDGWIDTPLLYFGGHCFTGDHEILTRDGWQRLDQWAGGEILQWTQDRLEFAQAVANRLDASGSGEKLLHLHSGQIELIATQGHWLATLDKKGSMVCRQAEAVRQVRCRIPLSGKFVGGSVSWAPWQVQLMVAIQADGHYLKDCRSIRFSFKRQRKIERLRQILTQSDLDWKEAHYPNNNEVTTFVIRAFPSWLEGRKEWTSDLLTWTAEALEIFRDELVHWDGSRNAGHASVSYDSVSRNNAEWVMTVAHLTGWAATFSVKHYKEYPKWRGLYRVTLRPRSSTEAKPSNWEELGLATQVYCPTAKHGICLFRFRGHVFLSHQTGRWSGGSDNERKANASERGGLNFQNFRKEPLICQKQPVDVRSLFIPAPGHKFVIADYSQIEPRVLAWLAEDNAFLDLVREGWSPYVAHAKLAMGYTGDEMDKKSDLYKLAKASRLGLGYGCGAKKFRKVAKNVADLELTEEQSLKAVEEFRATNPKIVKLWRDLDYKFKCSVGSEFAMVLPSGRTILYPSIKGTTKITNEWCEAKQKDVPTRTRVITADIGGRRRTLYGGLLTENLVQATARDVFAEGLQRVLRAGFHVPFHVHDEVIVQVPDGERYETIKDLLVGEPEWMPGLPVDVEGKLCERYEK